MLWQRYFTPGEMGRLAESRPSVCLSLWALFFSFFKRKRFDKIQVAELVNQGKGNEYKTAPKEAGSVLPARWKMHVENPWKYFK